MTYLQLVNNILKRLREDEVGSVNENHYSKLVGAFVNDAKRAVEDSWQWHSLLEAVTVTTEAGTASYDLEDYVTDSFNNPVNNRARVWRDLNSGAASVYCITSGYEGFLDEDTFASDAAFYAQQTNDGETGRPYKFFFTNNATAAETKSSLRLRLYETPDAVYQYRLQLVNPQAELDSDTTVMRVPAQPVIQLAYLYCLYERGEEVGEMLTLTSVKADAALSDAICQDLGYSGTTLRFINA